VPRMKKHFLGPRNRGGCRRCRDTEKEGGISHFFACTGTRKPPVKLGTTHVPTFAGRIKNPSGIKEYSVLSKPLSETIGVRDTKETTLVPPIGESRQLENALIRGSRTVRWRSEKFATLLRWSASPGRTSTGESSQRIARYPDLGDS